MRETKNVILQNLGWAVAYNIVAIPLAVTGLAYTMDGGNWDVYKFFIRSFKFDEAEKY